MPDQDSETDHLSLPMLLERLHRELGANPPTDEHSRQLLLELQADIARAISPANVGGEPALAEGRPHDLRERLQEAVAGFEGAHPQSAAALERVLVLLSNFGL